MADNRPASGFDAEGHDSKSIAVRSSRSALRTSATVPVAPIYLREQPGEKIAVFGNCVIAYLHQSMSLDSVAAIERAFEEITRRGARIAYLSILVPGEVSIDSTVKHKMSKVVASYTKQISGAAIVYKGDGFRATVVRSVITAIHWAGRASHPLHVFDDLDRALTWLRHQPQNEGLDVIELGSITRKIMG